MTKLCKDCRHYNSTLATDFYVPDRQYQSNRCLAFEGKEHPVAGGKMEWIECSAMRMGPCGMDGKLFEEQ